MGASGAAETVRRRYNDAYIVAQGIVSWGNTVKTLGFAGACLIGLVGLGGAERFGTPFTILFILLALIVGGMFYMAGVLIAAQGQVLQAQLDTAVNTSPLLSLTERVDLVTQHLSPAAAPDTPDAGAGI